ncbi:hypothetical protein E2R66_24920 [Mucilaginibacter psychrotolerans]|uniref:Uncharacterized protein n=2 Tax=Mucilaginibacter psychrotolerans TaxID=1524096 RepID=A0A4Y8S572_9SPHI|nr:hypothetical protein E2R66_24920 [Mucilaginibacter psychrotolerans]
MKPLNYAEKHKSFQRLVTALCICILFQVVKADAQAIGSDRNNKSTNSAWDSLRFERLKTKLAAKMTTQIEIAPPISGSSVVSAINNLQTQAPYSLIIDPIAPRRVFYKHWWYAIKRMF